MTTTPELIEQLAASARPVRRAWTPAARTAGWLALSLATIAGLAVLHGVRADLAARLGQFSFCAGFLAAVATGALAAFAAFVVSLPDRSRWWLLLPAPPALLWLTTVSYGCLAHWVRIEDVVVAPDEGVRCLTTLALSFLPLSLGMFWLLRRSARLRPRAASLAGSAAVGALTACALNLIHEYDASAFILIWNFGAAGVVVLADAAIGRAVLRPA